MTDQTIIYVLALLGWAGIIATQLRRRTTTIKKWLTENKWGLVSGILATVTTMLIGPGDDVDLGSYVARSWAAGMAAGLTYLLGGNIPSPDASERRMKARSESELKG